MLKNIPYYQNFTFLNGDLESFEEDNKLVFVLMPFGKNDEEKAHYNSIYETIRETIIEICFGGGVLKCVRADELHGQIVMEDICRHIKKASLLVFELTTPSINVYFELGLASALDKNILILINRRENPEFISPFDINQSRYIEYRNYDELKEKQKKRIEAILNPKKSGTSLQNEIYEKLKKITRHFNIDSKADQIRENYNISNYEIEKVCDALDIFDRNPDHESQNYKNVKYGDVQMEIIKHLPIETMLRIKTILEFLYNNEQYQMLISNLQNAPMEISRLRRDYEKKCKKKKDD
jgi:hypothetical protein